MKYQIKQLGLGGILDHSINIVRDNFGLLFGIVGVSIVPISLIVGFVQHIALTNGNGATAGIALLVAALLSIPISVLANIAVMYAVASVYLSVHPVLLWVELESAAVKEDCRFEVVAVTEASHSPFDGHDFAIHSFGDAVRDAVRAVADHIGQPFLDGTSH